MTLAGAACCFTKQLTLLDTLLAEIGLQIQVTSKQQHSPPLLLSCVADKWLLLLQRLVGAYTHRQQVKNVDVSVRCI